jgi:hypothetical protein
MAPLGSAEQLLQINRAPLALNAIGKYKPTGAGQAQNLPHLAPSDVQPSLAAHLGCATRSVADTCFRSFARRMNVKMIHVVTADRAGGPQGFHRPPPRRYCGI